jgi:hypothetical protein
MYVVIAHTANCTGGNCPTVWAGTDGETAEGEVLVQGTIHQKAGTPDGEAVVSIPLSVLRQALDGGAP